MPFITGKLKPIASKPPLDLADFALSFHSFEFDASGKSKPGNSSNA